MNGLKSKILFVDIPFAGGESSKEHRSKFMWDILHKYFDADLLLIKTPEFLTRKIPEISGYDQVHSISTFDPGLLKPKLVHQFSRENLEKYDRILQNRQYQLVFFRGESCVELAFQTEKSLSECCVVIDIDALLSEEEKASWLQNPVFKNRLHQVEQLRLRQLEKQLFRRHFHFTFSGKALRRQALDFAALPDDKKHFAVIPDPLPEEEYTDAFTNRKQTTPNANQEKYILFYGDLGKEANLDAFLYLTKDIYPRVSKFMQDKDIKIYVGGRNPQGIYEQLSGGRIKYLGEIEKLQEMILNSLFVVLPMRKAPAAARIREAALLGKAVLTTKSGVLENDVGQDSLAVETETEDFCKRLTGLLQNPLETDKMGQNLQEHFRQTYSRKKIEKDFLEFVRRALRGQAAEPQSVRLRIAIVTEFFQTGDNKIGTHIYNLALQLASNHDVTVFCPRRDYAPKHEKISGIEVYRLFDLLNYPIEMPNKKTSTLCPQLFFLLLSNDFDLIQCCPWLTNNVTMAFMVAKIREIPVLMNIFPNHENELTDSLQCETEQAGSRKLKLNWLQKQMLKNSDYLVTVTEKDYAWLRQYNDRVEQVPVPLNWEEFEAEIPSIREKYDISSDTFIYLCLGKITSRKGQDLALKAYAKALPALPDSKLVLVGRTDADPDFFEDQESFVIREALQENVIFTGAVEREEALSWLREADLQLIPARDLEIGSVVAESWASGTTVLQSDAVDPNLVIEDYNGYLFRSGDVDDLAQQIQKAFKNRSELAALADKGKVLVKSRHTYEFLAECYDKAYKQLTF